MDRWFIAVTAGRWQLRSIQQVRDLGFRVVAIDEDPNALGFEAADARIILPLGMRSEIIAELESMNVVFAGVASFTSDAGMILAGNLREHFGLHGMSVQETRFFLDKFLQRQTLDRAGVLGPRFRLKSGGESSENIAAEIGFPLIVKPADASGSRGVTKLYSPDNDLHSAVESAFLHSRSGRVLFESFMDGPEFTVETLSIDGHHHVLAVSEKKKAAGSNGLVARELATSERPRTTVNAIAETACAALSALGCRDGAGHTEVILMRDGSCGIVEVAARGGGFGVFDMFVPAVSGINVVRMLAMQATGAEIEVGPKLERAAILRFIMGAPGVVKGIHGMAAANSIDGVCAGSTAELGQEFGLVQSDGDRMGWILSVADSLEAAARAADTAEAAIEFELAP